MKTNSIKTTKAFSPTKTQSGDTFLGRFIYHLLYDVLSTVMILTLVGGCTVMATKNIDLVRNSHAVTLIESK